MSDGARDPVRVIAPGTVVTLRCNGSTTDDGVPAKVLEVKVTASGVEYLVSWWSDRTHYTEWFDDRAGVVSDGGQKRMTIGFATEEGGR